jgi:DNA polymerase
LALEPWSLRWKQQKLRELKEEWAGCEDCPELAECRHTVVFGHGNPMADVMLIGEGPGTTEDDEGLPFVGPSGELLAAMLSTFGRDFDNDMYRTNVIMCRAPENRDPTREEKLACRQRMLLEIYIVDPMVVVLAGNVAMKALLKGRETAITKAQGKLNTMKISGISFELEYDCMPIYHPAFILREEKVGKSGKYASDGKAMETRDHLRSLFDAVELTKQRYRRYEEEF